jgi:adenosine deaminase
MNLQALPKAELHCHLDGVLSPAMARAIRRDDPAFPVTPEDFAPYYPIEDMESFFNWWKALNPINRQLPYFFPILAQHIATLKAQNTRYAEMMIASSFIPDDIAAAVDAFTAFRAWGDRQAAGDIDIAFLVAFGRNKTPEAAAEVADRVMPLYEAGLIVGVALAGPEIENPVKPFERTFARYHEAGLGIEIHAGEWCGPESVWDALEHGHPNRIGHGVSLFRDPALVALFQERQIHIEMCPTSNLKTGSVARIEEHPIRRARDLGLNFSVNTDDPGPFLNSLTSEYQLLADTFGFDEADFRRVYENTLGARFRNSGES